MEREIDNNLNERKASNFEQKAMVLDELYKVLKTRKAKPVEDSYTSNLFKKGIDRILKKVGEEAGEVIIAAKNDSKEELIYETADLLFHLMMTMVEKGVSLEEVFDELRRRREKKDEKRN